MERIKTVYTTPSLPLMFLTHMKRIFSRVGTAARVARTALLSSLLVIAFGVLQAEAKQSEIRLPNGEYTESHVDLSVKVWGGEVEILRT